MLQSNNHCLLFRFSSPTSEQGRALVGPTSTLCTGVSNLRCSLGALKAFLSVLNVCPSLLGPALGPSLLLRRRVGSPWLRICAKGVLAEVGRDTGVTRPIHHITSWEALANSTPRAQIQLTECSPLQMSKNCSRKSGSVPQNIFLEHASMQRMTGRENRAVSGSETQAFQPYKSDLALFLESRQALLLCYRLHCSNPRSTTTAMQARSSSHHPCLSCSMGGGKSCL